MALEIEDFKIYTDYPIGLCAGYKEGSQKENMLAYMINKCIEAKNMYEIIVTLMEHPTLVSDGLLERVEPFKYKLTKKSLTMILAHQNSK
jgi:hypothetical protein